MLRKYYIILTALLLVTGLFANQNQSDIPADSVSAELYRSFTSKLDSAVHFTQNNQHEKAVPLFAASFEAFKHYNEKRREHTEKYLTELYETEQKEQRIRFLDETLPLKRKQNILLVILCMVLVITLIIVYFFLKYHLYNIGQRAEQKENENRLNELEKEERLLENRLHTMETEKYQKELLAESLLVNYKNKVIDDLRLFFIRNPELKAHKTELEAILSEQSNSPEAVDFNPAVDDIHPTFYTRLQEQANHKLTPLELDYCRMIYMKMSSKEMADILGIDPKSVRIGKYRLKRKLGLNKENDLFTFIESTGASH